MKLYVASSWRNTDYAVTIEALRELGHEIWDWRNPPTGGTGFRWTDVASDYAGGEVDTDTYRNMLLHPAAEVGYASDRKGMEWCECGVLLLPSGISAHTEAGWIRGYGKQVFVLRPYPTVPDLMYKLFNGVFGTMNELIGALEQEAAKPR